MALEKTLKGLLDCKEIKPVDPKGKQLWIFIGRTDAEADTPILWPPDAKKRLIGKDPDAWEDWRQEKRTTEDEMVGWHHWLSKFEQTLGDSEGQESVACCSPWGPTKSWTQLSNWPTTQYCTVSTDTCRDARMWRRTPGRRTNLCEWIGKCTFTSLKVCNLKARVSGTYCINFSF